MPGALRYWFTVSHAFDSVPPQPTGSQPTAAAPLAVPSQLAPSTASTPVLAQDSPQQFALEGASGASAVSPFGDTCPSFDSEEQIAVEQQAAADMVRLRLVLSYDGTAFHGWARQRDRADGSSVRTVQGVVEAALSQALQSQVSLTVAGRTDAGVHAQAQVAHCDVPRTSLDSRSISGDPARLVRRLARLLPEDVSLRAAEFAPPGFDARFSALRRHYVYRVTTSPSGALPTRVRDTTVWPRAVDVDLLQQAADPLVGLHDFVAFCKAKPNATTVRHLQRFEWRDVSTEAEPELYEAHVVADAFCWSMVRSLVGACLSVAEGRRPLGFTKSLLEESTRSSLVPVAAARGLTLVGVDYPVDAELAARATQTRAVREPATGSAPTGSAPTGSASTGSSATTDSESYLRDRAANETTPSQQANGSGCVHCDGEG